MKVLITCPPMLGMVEEFTSDCIHLGLSLECPKVVQTLSEAQLLELVPRVDGWIIGDDPATRKVLEMGKSGRLRAAVKWGIGTDNVDLQAARELGLPLVNTPGMFGREVADLAMSYLVALARQTFEIDRRVRLGEWPKPRGISLAGRTIGLVGLGDIGRQVARRALAADMDIIAFDPNLTSAPTGLPVNLQRWPAGLERCDFLVLACALTPHNRHMVNADVLAVAKRGLRLINVSRGALIDQPALIAALQSGQVFSAALDVFEEEPLPSSAPLRNFERCILGSHNASNTSDAVMRASREALSLIARMLGQNEYQR